MKTQNLPILLGLISSVSLCTADEAPSVPPVPGEPVPMANPGTTVPNSPAPNPGIPLPIEVPAAVVPANPQIQGGTPVYRQTAPLQVPQHLGLRQHLGDNPPPEPSVSSLPDPITVSSSEGAGQEWTATSVAVFEGPCHFPGRCVDSQSTLPGDSLLIYEGMQLQMDDFGRFELSFVAEVPDIPAVLRLQLHIHEASTIAPVGSITIPPVILETQTSYSQHQAGKTIQVKRRGFSATLHRLQQGDTDPILSFTRAGTVRFGSIPARADYPIVTDADLLLTR